MGRKPKAEDERQSTNVAVVYISSRRLRALGLKAGRELTPLLKTLLKEHEAKLELEPTSRKG